MVFGSCNGLPRLAVLFAAPVDVFNFQAGFYFKWMASFGAVAMPDEQRCLSPISSDMWFMCDKFIPLPLFHQDGSYFRLRIKIDFPYDPVFGHGKFLFQIANVVVD